MELKTARLTLLIDPNKKEAFERLCARQDLTASQVVRQLIREYLAQHGVEYTAAGSEEGAADRPEQGGAAAPPRKPKARTPSSPAPAARKGRRRR